MNKKPKNTKTVLYIGNLNPSTTEESLKTYIAKRAEKLGFSALEIFMINCRVFSKDDRKGGLSPVAFGGQITVPSKAFQVYKSFLLAKTCVRSPVEIQI